jgi:uncharacterized membrane protein
MNRALWTAQVLLAFAFLMAGRMTLVTPYEGLAADMAWVAHVPAAAVKLIGLLEVLAAVGLVLPSANQALVDPPRRGRTPADHDQRCSPAHRHW